MDLFKKRKLEENGVVPIDPDAFNLTNPPILTADDARKILDPLTRDHMLEILQTALLRHGDVLDAVRSFADRDTTQRKLFVRGLGWETTTDKLRALFSSYGELDEAVVINDKATGKSKGYGFVTFKHVDGAIRALKEPSKKIDGRMTVTQLAAAGTGGGGGGGGGGGVGGQGAVDVSMRKIYVSNVPYDMPGERLLQHFAMYGEIEEGPLGFDKATGRSKGFALFVYKTAEGARAALVDAVKSIDGCQLSCKLAIDGKRGKVGGGVGVQGGSQGNGEGVGVGSNVPVGQYGGPGGGYGGGYSGGLGAGAGVGGPGFSGVGGQAAGSNVGMSGGFGSGVGGPYGGGSHFGGSVGSGYGGLGGSGGGAGGGYSGVAGGLGGLGGAGGPVGGLGGAGGSVGGLGGAGGMGAVGRGSYGLPPSSAGMGSGDYPHSSHYSLSGGGYQSQPNQPTGALSGPRVPPGGAFPGMPPYY